VKAEGRRFPTLQRLIQRPRVACPMQPDFLSLMPGSPPPTPRAPFPRPPQTHLGEYFKLLALLQAELMVPAPTAAPPRIPVLPPHRAPGKHDGEQHRAMPQAGVQHRRGFCSSHGQWRTQPPRVQLFPCTSRDSPSLYILYVSFLPGRLFRMLRFVRCVPVPPPGVRFIRLFVDPSTNLWLCVLCFRRITTIVGSAAHRPALPPWEHPSGRGSEALSLRKLLAPGLPRGWGTRG